MLKQNSFYVTLLSNGSLNYYPENSLSKFTVKLPYTIDTSNDENWQVGLRSASYTDIEKQLAEEIVIKISSKDETFENSQTTLVSIIYNTKEFYDKIKKPDFFKQFKNIEYSVLPEYKNKTQYIRISLTSKINVALQRNVQYTLKELFTLVFKQIKKEDREVAIKEYLKYLNEYNPSNAFYILTKFEKQIKNPNSHYICFYTDISRPSIINGIESRLLFIKPILTLDKTELTVSNIQYHPVDKFRMNEISILIADEHGEQINFKEGTHCTCIVLHFHKSI